MSAGHTRVRPPASSRVRGLFGIPPARRHRDFAESDRAIFEDQFTAEIDHRDTRYRRLLGLADAVAAAVTVLVVIGVLGDADQLRWPLLVGLPLVVVVGKLSGLYDRDELLVRKSTLDEVPALLRTSLLFTFTAWLAVGWAIEGQIGKGQLLTFWLVLFALTVLMRGVARSVATRVNEPERCLIVGPQTASHWVEDRFHHAGAVRATVVGHLDFSSSGRVHELEPIVAAERVHRVVIAPEGYDSEDILEVIRQVKSMGVKVSVMPRLFEVIGASAERDEIDGVTLLGLRRHGLTRSSRGVKRALDLLGAGFALLVLGPLMAVLAVAVRLDGPGPILFRQKRIGRGDEPFEIFKYRSMVDGAEDDKHALRDRNEAGTGLFKIDHDPRITTVGRFLRRTSLDELPQLFNVVRGEMSLVGPRPLVPDDDVHITGWQRRRLYMPPGMTGMWQVFGSARIPLEEMVKIDYLYGANWSLWLDIKILLRTVGVVLLGRGM